MTTEISAMGGEKISQSMTSWMGCKRTQTLGTLKAVGGVWTPEFQWDHVQLPTRLVKTINILYSTED